MTKHMKKLCSVDKTQEADYKIPQTLSNDAVAELAANPLSGQKGQTVRVYKIAPSSLLQPRYMPGAHWWSDTWLLLTVLLACVASVTSLWYFFSHHQILLVSDTYAHLLIARRLFDNLTPGISQLGGVWLPLPHILMVPFIWNDYLWHTGLAGSFVAMPCYVISALYLFLTARRLTHNGPASFVGTLTFILNPNVLYLQTTPLSELVLIATMTGATYYFLIWVQEERIADLVRAATATCLATLTRYDGWPMFVVLLLLIVIIGRLKRERWERTEAHLILFGILGGIGIILWCLWCAIIFKDPLYWQHSIFSSQAQQTNLPRQLRFLHTNILIDYHNIWQSIHSYTLDSIDNVGLWIFVWLTIAVAIFYFRRHPTPEMVAIAIVLVPFPFYVFSLFSGQAVIFVPGAAPAHATLKITYYNVRYGIEMVAPAAIFLATLANRSWRLPRLHKDAGRIIFRLGLSITIVVQSIMILFSGIITLQDGNYGFECVPLYPVVLYMSQHYNGGKILSEGFSSDRTMLGPEAGIAFKNMVYEGSGTLWDQALANPESTVDWVIVNPRDPNDLVAQHLDTTNQVFLSQFTLELQADNGLEVFHRNTAPPLVLHAVSIDELTTHKLCTI